MNERARRIGDNEALFRQINERLEGLNDALGWVTGTFQVVCECGNPSCVDRFTVEPAEYEHVRADPATFAVVRGHEDPAVETVVEDHGPWVLLRKHGGGPADLARETDPRP